MVYVKTKINEIISALARIKESSVNLVSKDKKATESQDAYIKRKKAVSTSMNKDLKLVVDTLAQLPKDDSYCKQLIAFDFVMKVSMPLIDPSRGIEPGYTDVKNRLSVLQAKLGKAKTGEEKAKIQAEISTTQEALNTLEEQYNAKIRSVVKEAQNNLDVFTELARKAAEKVKA